jgi:DNA-binding NtrC family response regulator
MPHMSGPALARSVLVRRPDLKVLFITGGPDAELARYDTLSAQGDVLRKPFTNDALLETVRRVLDQPIDQRFPPFAPHKLERILLIDDDEQINSMLQEMLKSERYQLLAAASGEEGVTLLRNVSVDLLITDVLMPDMDGLEVIQKIRRHWPSMKILAMSGGGLGATPDFYLDMARHLGAVKTLAKPFSREQLLNAVREMIG